MEGAHKRVGVTTAIFHHLAKPVPADIDQRVKFVILVPGDDD